MLAAVGMTIVGVLAYRRMNDEEGRSLVSDLGQALPAGLLDRAAGRYAPLGVFIALEGGEGAGKSTQSRRLQEWLRRRGVRRGADPGAGGHRHRPGAAPDRPRPGHRLDVGPHRGAALRRRQGRARRPGRGPGPRARRRGRHRPLRRLHAGLPGSRPRPRRRRGGADRALGHRRPAPPPDRAARPRARRPAWAASRSATGSRRSPWSSTSGCGRCSCSSRPPRPSTTSSSTPAPRSTRSPPRIRERVTPLLGQAVAAGGTRTLRTTGPEEQR